MVEKGKEIRLLIKELTVEELINSYIIQTWWASLGFIVDGREHEKKSIWVEEWLLTVEELI